MSQIETCFFERYAIASLRTILGSDYYTLVNRDRPDLQTPDGHTIGIEVTRAMEQSKEAANLLLDEAAGVKLRDEDREDFDRIMSSGYGYGLQNGMVIGARERYYWELAKPLKQIIESKVSKAVCGLYGEFERMGLYVFCKDALSETDVIKTIKYTRTLQENYDRGYQTLFISEINQLHVCNLRDGIGDSARIISFDIPQEMRRDFYIQAL